MFTLDSGLIFPDYSFFLDEANTVQDRLTKLHDIANKLCDSISTLSDLSGRPTITLSANSDPICLEDILDKLVQIRNRLFMKTEAGIYADLLTTQERIAGGEVVVALAGLYEFSEGLPNENSIIEKIKKSAEGFFACSPGKMQKIMDKLCDGCSIARVSYDPLAYVLSMREIEMLEAQEKGEKIDSSQLQLYNALESRMVTPDNISYPSL